MYNRTKLGRLIMIAAILDFLSGIIGAFASGILHNNYKKDKNKKDV